MLLQHFGIISEHRDGRRVRLDLRRVVQLDLVAGGLRRLASREQLLECVVHHRRGDALAALGVHLGDHVEHLRHALAGEGRREEERDELQEGSLLRAFLLELRGGLVALVLLDVPLVHDHDQPAPRFPRERGDLQVLVVQAFGRIDQQQADVRAVDRAAGPE